MTSNAPATTFILGATGLLGYHCSVEMKENGFDVIGTYNTHKLEGSNCYQFNALTDLEKLESLFEKYQPTSVVNTIALVTVDGCEENPDLAKVLNTDFVKKLVQIMKKTGLKDSHLIQISSDSVYGNKSDEDVPLKEDYSTDPISVYAETKLLGEKEALKHEGPTTVLRTAFYGINPYSTKSLLWWIIDQTRLGNPMNGWENIYFSPVSAGRLAKAIRYMIDEKVVGLFNIGSVDTCNKFDFVNQVCKTLNLNATVNRSMQSASVEKKIRPDNTSLDNSRLQSKMKWDLNWKDDLTSYIKYMPPFPSKKQN